MNNNKHKIIVKRLTSILVCIIFFAEGMMFYNHYSYAHHIDQAKNELYALENILEGNVSPSSNLKASVLDALDASEDTDIKLKNISKRIVNSVEHAIEIADDIKSTNKLKKAVDDIQEVQEESIGMIESAIEHIENEYVEKEVESTYKTALNLQKRVGQASDAIQEALDNNQKRIAINIVTSKDKHHNGHGSEDTMKNNHDGYVDKSSHNYIRVQEKKEEDAKERTTNIERIKLIESGKVGTKSRDLQRKMEEAQRKRASREKQTT